MADTILGDKTITSLLDIVELEEEKKQEIRDLLPSMDKDDRRNIIDDLLKLLSLRVGKEVTLRQAEMVAQSAQNPDALDWEKFTEIEDEVLKQIVGKQ